MTKEEAGAIADDVKMKPGHKQERGGSSTAGMSAEKLLNYIHPELYKTTTVTTKSSRIVDDRRGIICLDENTYLVDEKPAEKNK